MRIRTAAAIAFLASASALPAPGRDIPPALLAHEANVRAALTPAQKAHVAGLAARITPAMSVQDVVALGQGEPAGSLFLFMLEYEKMLNKEAREDRKANEAMRQLSSQAKAARLARVNQELDQKMKEAEERATRLMDAATTGMTLGIISGSAQITGGRRLSPTPTPTPVAVPHVIGPTRK